MLKVILAIASPQKTKKLIGYVKGLMTADDY